MNCIEVIAPKKKIVGTAKAWIANQRNVKIGYATERLRFLFIIFKAYLFLF